MSFLKKGKPQGRENEKMDLLREELERGAKFVKFSMNVPRVLHKEFKRKSFLEEKDMKDILMEAIVNYLKNDD